MIAWNTSTSARDFVRCFPERLLQRSRAGLDGTWSRPWFKAGVKEGELFLWPLMAVLWAFDVECVARRSFIAKWIVGCQSVRECTDAFLAARDQLGDGLRPVENFPRHEDMRA